jgi:transposase-like protein
MSNDASKKARVAQDKSEVIRRLPAACRDEAAAVAFMEAQRWGDNPTCAHCGDANVFQIRDRKTRERNKRYLWYCRECKRQYTVRIGTVFEDSRIPLMYWCHAFWRACASKKGVSALQIKRETGLSYKSALFLMHRIRWAMAEDHAAPRPLRGIVEIDETYVGGKPRNQHKSNQGFHRLRKAAVVALVERGGDLRASHVMRTRTEDLRRLMRRSIDPSASVMTDSSPIYKRPGKEFARHEAVNHHKREYVRGDAHVNTAESFFAILKRAIYGTYHSVSKKHLHRYVSQAEYMWNTRKMDDGARTVLAIKSAQGKRLRYREPLDTAKRGGENG